MPATMKTTLAAVLWCSVAAAAALALPASQHNVLQTESDLLDAVYADCLKKDSVSCLKYKLFSFVDKMLGHKDTITVTEGVQIVKSGGGGESGAPRALSADDSVESLIMDRIANFLESHTIKVDLKGSEIVNAVSSTARSLGDVYDSLSEEDNEIATEEGRGKKKKVQKILGPLMAAAALKAAVIGKLFLATIALIAGKALLIGKIALVLSAIIGLKKLLGQQKHVTYEVVQHPQHSTSHVSSHEAVYAGGGGSGHGGGFGGDIGGGYGGGGGGGGGGSAHGGWGRSLDPQELAYRGHPQVQQQQ